MPRTGRFLCPEARRARALGRRPSRQLLRSTNYANESLPSPEASVASVVLVGGSMARATTVPQINQEATPSYWEEVSPIHCPPPPDGLSEKEFEVALQASAVGSVHTWGSGRTTAWTWLALR